MYKVVSAIHTQNFNRSCDLDDDQTLTMRRFEPPLSAPYFCRAFAMRACATH